ncbi:hypothetical Protein YC6258_01712 [Gynuella sunshinyii YC6258]|uniref:Uncharacterized protein n=1 Tax=Gynuella sunshinyii YC6258 TaxID=1445510 RepID=A0A0C5V2R3_9GAMM|nr:hypothetical Protein YC6258_01712 [Gynuella sunshinyii YC6258]
MVIFAPETETGKGYAVLWLFFSDQATILRHQSSKCGYYSQARHNQYRYRNKEKTFKAPRQAPTGTPTVEHR